MKKRINSDFIKNALTVVTGTSLSQIIPLAFYPIFTRLYNPEDFGLMAFFMSITAVVILLSSGAYEQAILICKDKAESETLIKLLLLRSLIMLVVISVILLMSIHIFPYLFKYKVYQNWILVVVFTSLFTIIFNLYNEWCVKQKEFKKLAVNKVYNSSFITLSKFVSKFFSFISNGLIIGELAGKLIVSLISVRSMISMGNNIFKGYDIKLLKKARLKFKQYPRYMMFDMLINTLGGSVHVYIILAYFSTNELGYLSLSLSLLTLPVTVISAGIKDVFREKANQLFINEGSCRSFYLELLKPLVFFGFIGFGILYLIVPYIFPLALGGEWVKSGLYAQYLIPLFYFNFVSMSLGGIFIIANKIKVSLYWQIFNLISTVIALLIGSIYYHSMALTIILLTISKSISYIIYAIMSYKYSLNFSFAKN
ncbi:MAG: lipopolysaccharide biosynthesis protein [Flavobacteriaceae bacterium]|nr:lipopolysaccharide biosynthesis protein [Flavobacteriaceae bacterium]